MSEQCGHEVALEKRLNEIRRLETINDDLLAALEGLRAALRLTDKGFLWKGKELREHGILDIGAFFEAWPAAEAAIKKSRRRDVE